MADTFMEKSSVNFLNCDGCIGGILMQTNEFSLKDLEGVLIGPNKFLMNAKTKME